MAQLDWICMMYAKDHPGEMNVVDTQKLREQMAIIEEQKAWWDVLKNPETRKEMLYHGKRPVIPGKHLSGQTPSAGVLTGRGGKPIDLAGGEDPFAAIREK
ncbi:MAG: hypothetical protein ACYCOU_10730 [Sulfobacillus sp.]